MARNSELLISEVGVGDSGLVCRTDHPQCCNSSTDAVWLSPNGVTILSTRGDGDFYVTRGDGYITLNRYSNTTSAAGIYCCVVPVSGGSIQLFCTVLALSKGVVSILFYLSLVYMTLQPNACHARQRGEFFAEYICIHTYACV